MPRVLLEVCAGSLDEALCAHNCGADRIEYCAALGVGGLTPTPGMMEELKARAPGLPVMAMVRSREGGFVYSADEFHVMLRDAKRLVAEGADGIVFGFLRDDGTLDVDRTKQMVAAAGGRATMMHRSFDGTPDLFKTVDLLAELGVTRALTSGGAGKAPLGAETLRRLIGHAAGRLEILPGGGILPENVAALVAASGCDQVHFAARKEGVRSYAGTRDMEPDPDTTLGIRRSLEG